MKGALCLSHALQPDVSGWGMNWSHNVFWLTWVCWILHGFPWWSMFWCDSLPRASSLRKTQGLRFPRAVLCQRWSSRGALGFPGSVMTSFFHPDALRPQIWLMFLMRFPRGVRAPHTSAEGLEAVLVWVPPLDVWIAFLLVPNVF